MERETMSIKLEHIVSVHLQAVGNTKYMYVVTSRNGDIHKANSKHYLSPYISTYSD